MPFARRDIVKVDTVKVGKDEQQRGQYSIRLDIQDESYSCAVDHVAAL
jgi:hypothetical protein